ncbi:MAG: hypothetical protein CME64_08465 [Halobacteriovoraceae bacterium]|nr:hypothetical protein [Halobacteriovoraceae bacterium]|tara:strand:+ start:229969 stop:230316 length:348 start_codon:yes stop_codon:yes gene_type:complete
MKILLVDDDPSVTVLLKEFLRLKHQVHECKSGDEAIALIGRSNIKFDLIICDYKMPNGNGIDVLEFINAHSFDTRFILFTSNTDLEVPVTYDRFLGLYPKDDLDKLLKDIPSDFY